MTTFRPCSVPGCERKHFAKGWCHSHYTRWLAHGSPTGGRTAPREPLRYFETVVLRSATDECVLWPYATTSRGYAVLVKNGNKALVHRLSCEAVCGAAPSSSHQAAHSCGVPQCVNPRHLRWATPEENEADKIAHGTALRGARHNMAKLTTADVLAIRSLVGAVTQVKLAAKYGVSKEQIGNIQRRESWRSVP